MTARPLEGQVAIVTGGAGFIGRAITAALAVRGARVFTADLVSAEVEHAVGALECDVTDSTAVNRAVPEAQAVHGRLTSWSIALAGARAPDSSTSTTRYGSRS